MAKIRMQLSFKENSRDLNIYNFLNEDIKDTLGISTYIKMLIEKDEAYQEYKRKKSS